MALKGFKFFEMKNGIRLALVAGCMLVPTSSFALEKGFLTEEDLVRPQPIKELQWIEREDKPFGPISTMPMDIRRDAQIEAATSYGARGGLAWQTFSIRQELKQRARYMDKVYDFGQLLIPAPSGLLIEPPIVSESANAMIIEYGAQEAAVSDRIYHIIQNARIVSSPRTWQAYLEREWGRVQPPPDVLRPANGEERDLWIKYVNRGWDEGVRQANEIFQDDLALLTADFEGMVRYRMLLSQGMISPPKALQIDRGVTGGGNEMRVGDRAVQITGVPELITGADEWKPANR